MPTSLAFWCSWPCSLPAAPATLLAGREGHVTAPVDTLLVPDGQLLRFTRYTPDGSVLPSFPMVLQAGRPMRFKANPSGMMAEQARPLAAIVPDSSSGDELSDVIVLLGAD